MKDFIFKGEIQSICAPYFCGECKTEFNAVYTIQQLESMDLQKLSAECTNCKAATPFDEIVEQYFSFILE